jgi:hypothetical protein
MVDKLITQVNEGVGDVKSLSAEAVKELDRILNELTKIAKRDHLSPKPNPTERRKKILKRLGPNLKELGGPDT